MKALLRGFSAAIKCHSEEMRNIIATLSTLQIVDGSKNIKKQDISITLVAVLGLIIPINIVILVKRNTTIKNNDEYNNSLRLFVIIINMLTRQKLFTFKIYTYL
jgi:hypothetical protein